MKRLFNRPFRISKRPLSVLERCPSFWDLKYRKWLKKWQVLKFGVRFIEVSVLSGWPSWGVWLYYKFAISAIFVISTIAIETTIFASLQLHAFLDISAIFQPTASKQHAFPSFCFAGCAFPTFRKFPFALLFPLTYIDRVSWRFLDQIPDQGQCLRSNDKCWQHLHWYWQASGPKHSVCYEPWICKHLSLIEKSKQTYPWN